MIDRLDFMKKNIANRSFDNISKGMCAPNVPSIREELALKDKAREGSKRIIK